MRTNIVNDLFFFLDSFSQPEDCKIMHRHCPTSEPSNVP
jgi:hypothetical protein